MVPTIYETNREDFLVDRFKEELVAIMQESEEFNYPEIRISDDFGDKEYLKLKHYFLNNMASVRLLMDGNNILSYVWYFLKENSIHVNEIATNVEHRGKGYGTTLLQSLIADTSKKGADSIELYVLENNIAAMEFYKRMGFVTERRLMRRRV